LLSAAGNTVLKGTKYKISGVRLHLHRRNEGQFNEIADSKEIHAFASGAPNGTTPKNFLKSIGSSSSFQEYRHPKFRSKVSSRVRRSRRGKDQERHGISGHDRAHRGFQSFQLGTQGEAVLKSRSPKWISQDQLGISDLPVGKPRLKLELGQAPAIVAIKPSLAVRSWMNHELP
jgi:hypothetical protein